MFKAFLIVGLGSFFGGGSRYLVQQLVTKLTTISFPYGTLTVNILGSFIIGVIFALGAKSNLISNELKLLLATGFCGGFTTFSSFSLETLSLMKSGQFLYAFAYLALSIILGFAATFLAIKIF